MDGCHTVGTCDPVTGCSQPAKPDGTACVEPNATAACTGGVCTVTGCSAGHADCNGLASDGCEVVVDTDTANCGACGHACAPATACSKAQFCSLGVCAGDPQPNNTPCD